MTIAFLAALGMSLQAPQSLVLQSGPPQKLKSLKVADLVPGKGKGAAKGDLITVLYRGTLVTGVEFDGNMDAKNKPKMDRDPFALVLGQGSVIKGWEEGLKGIKVGAVRKISIPFAMGYGDTGSGSIPAKSDLYFTVKCLDIITPANANVVDKKDLKVGKGAAVKSGDRVTIHYTGTLLNGKKFDSSIDRKAPFSFTVGKGEVITGFDQGVTGMKKGGKRRVRIPPAAAYGQQANGPIPGNSVLVFELEVLQINGK